MTLRGHVVRIVGLQVVAALAVLMGVLQVLDLLDVTPDIVDRGLGAGGITYYSLLRLPRLFEQAAPLAALAGGLFGFTRLARNSEVTAMRAAGVSAYRLVLMTLPIGVFLMAAQVLSGMAVAPYTDQVLANWWRETTPAAARKAEGAQTFRVGTDIVIGVPSPDGGRLGNVTIYRRAADGQLTQTLSAATAAYRPDGWLLQSPTVQTIAPGEAQTAKPAQLLWKGDLTPTEVQAVVSGAPLSPEVAAAAARGEGAVRPRSYYETQLQRFIADPAACLIMLLIALPVALANFRSGRGGPVLVMCLAAGLVFLVVDGVFVAVGEGGLAPAWLAAWAAPGLFAGLALTALLHLER
jgi:lipopolysaccharide export system permease protein